MSFRFAACALAAIMLLAAPAPARADATELRIFLRDGTTLASYGEYAQVNGRIVFSLPLGEDHGAPRLQLVSLPAAQVDWPRTTRYRDTVRAAQYAATRGESDFVLMTGEVAQVLNEMSLTTDPQRRLQIAEEARRRLHDWPAEHFGYRAKDVQEIAGMLDEAVSELRTAAGQPPLALDLVARPAEAAAEPLLPPPTPRERIAEALSLVDFADSAAERVALLEATLGYLDAARAVLPDTSWRAAHDFAERRLAGERAADRAYAQLARQVAGLATERAVRADVRGLERLLASIPRRDRSLGRRRPDEVRRLITSVQQQLDAARRLRLARDQWRLRRSAYRSYHALVRQPLQELQAMQAGLEDIRRLAGPDAATLSDLARHAEQARTLLNRAVPPADLANVHTLLQSACELGANAARIRLEAVSSGNMQTAWNASAAAAGAIMLAARARDELARYLEPPSLR
jgi:hypothetical protein